MTETSPAAHRRARRSRRQTSDRKGVSLPDTVVPFAALAPKDLADLEAALDAGIDWVALSFIQRPEDIAEAKKITRGRAAVMAKIEKPQAVTRLDDILDLADALMVARGDLGVEMPLEKVPGVQKQMTRACRRAGKPVVVATQMLELMITSPVPTRAEVSDVATAIFDGADAVMLSAEFGGRAISGRGGGDHEPHRRGSGERADLSRHHCTSCAPSRKRPAPTPSPPPRGRSPRRSISSAIVCWTSSGSTGAAGLARAAAAADRRHLADRRRPGGNCRWSGACIASIAEDARDQDDMVERACRIAFREGFAKAGQRVIVVAGVPFGTPGATNMIRIAFIGPDSEAAA